MKVRMKEEARSFLFLFYDDGYEAERQISYAELRAANKFSGGRKQKKIWAFVRANRVTPFNTKVFFERKDFEVV